MGKLLRLPLREASKAAAEFVVKRHGGEVVETECEGATCYAVRGTADAQSMAEAAWWALNFEEPQIDEQFTVKFHERDDLFLIPVWRA